MKSCLTDLYFLPPIAFFNDIFLYDEIIIEANDNFIKQSYRNRAHILGANGIQQLNIPVEKAQTKKLYKDVKIDYNTNWARKNYQALKSAYSNSPFFDDYYVFIDQILNKKNTYLFDLNLDLLNFCFKVLELDKIITLTNSFHSTYNNKIDFRELHNNKKKKTSDWVKNDIKSYTQVFGNKFVNNLSIIDLAFNNGPESIKYFI